MAIIPIGARPDLDGLIRSELYAKIDSLNERIPDLESRDFYEVMQAYRHEPLDAHKQFEAVKAWLRNPTYPYEHPDTLKVPRPEGHDSWSIEIKTAFGGGGGGGSYPDTGETTSPSVAD